MSKSNTIGDICLGCAMRAGKIDELKAEVRNRSTLLDESLDWLQALESEWRWKAAEPRAGNQREYLELVGLIERIRRTEKIEATP